MFDFRNISTRDYESAPPDDVFEDIKAKAIRIWKTYDNTYGYVDEKVTYIEPLKNVGSNAWTIVGMFDDTNQQRLYNTLEPSTILYLETFLSGGSK